MIAIILDYLMSTLSFLAAAGDVVLNSVRSGSNARVRCVCKNRVQGKVVVITGANSGIGYSTAHDLAKKGAKVYLACRNIEAGEAAALKLRSTTDNQNIYFLHLDLADFSSIHSFVRTFLGNEEHVDALVNNAAIFHHPQAFTVNNIDITYQTNFLGVFLLTSLLLDSLHKSPAPRIVFVSSEAHRLVTVEDLTLYNAKQVNVLDTFSNHVRNYGLSKLALHLFTQHLCEKKGCTVVLVEPGNVWTGIYRHAWQKWSELFVYLRCYILMKGTEEGAQSTIHALNSPYDLNRKYINNCLVAEENISCNPDLVKKFITVSSLLCNLQPPQQ